MELIVGLGNPGKKYERTRHNLGFMVIDELARRWQLNWRTDRKRASLKTLKKTESAEVLLAKPQTFMNESGLVIAKLARFYKVKPKDIWVLHDDVDLPLEKIKIVKGRGAAGHKGVMSVIEELGTIGFVRFRLGVGHPHAGRVMKNGKRVFKFDTPREVEDFVLAPFLPTEADEVKKLIKKAIKAIETALQKGIEKTMNRYN